ncbi:hypothetical protein [Paenibacillus naphthalenovorans]|uniref:hypothetical protein n=1 Tax=Paenibacillus naphthalenovorans TaxID=162209 RepID=UPI0008901D69|nr:hypothetical protein [Paenibacillus naphthalenovorans]SDK01771.1 hypothetical protein SAMN05421868_1942 [Paenibacillus naphthalenovorans]
MENYLARLEELQRLISTNQITEREALEELIDILPKMNAISDALIRESERMLDQLNEDLDVLKDIGIAGMLAQQFIEHRGFYDEFQIFANNELLKIIDETNRPNIH